MRKLASYPKQNQLAKALAELGKIERTIFLLQWLEDPQMRRRTMIGLNKGENVNAVEKILFFGRKGSSGIANSKISAIEQAAWACLSPL